jgi:hypothetical protein
MARRNDVYVIAGLLQEISKLPLLLTPLVYISVGYTTDTTKEEVVP